MQYIVLLPLLLPQGTTTIARRPTPKKTGGVLAFAGFKEGAFATTTTISKDCVGGAVASAKTTRLSQSIKIIAKIPKLLAPSNIQKELISPEIKKAITIPGSTA